MEDPPHYPGSRQPDLFPERPVQPGDVTDFLAEARAELNAALATARAADRMPWDARKLRYWEVVFPQMSNWLPDDEATELRAAFARELERLKAADEESD